MLEGRMERSEIYSVQRNRLKTSSKARSTHLSKHHIRTSSKDRNTDISKHHLTNSSNDKIITIKKQNLTNSMHLQKIQQSSKSVDNGQEENNSYLNIKIKSLADFRYPAGDKVKDQQNTYGYGVNIMQDYKRKNKRLNIFASLKTDSLTTLFLKKVQEKQYQFQENCKFDRYQQAIQVIVILLNYSIDMNLPLFFTKTLNIIAEVYFITQNINEAFFYFNEARQSSILLNQHSCLIKSLIGFARCSSKVNMERQSIIFLKKALEYCWLYDNKQYQLLVYDEIGKRYYHIGDIEKAKKYHLRYINAITQASNSALKMLSRQRILKRQELNSEIKYQNLDRVLLVHLKVPIRSIHEVKPVIQKEQHYAREQIVVSQKYHKHFQKIQDQIRKMLNNWFFKDQIQEPQLSNEDWTLPLKLKKFAFIDFKLNQTLKKYQSYKNKVIAFKDNPLNKKFSFKLALEQKIAHRLKQPSLEKNWYQIMVSQIKRDHKNKLLNVRNAVRIRDYNKPYKPSVDTLKDIYNEFFLGNIQTQ